MVPQCYNHLWCVTICFIFSIFRLCLKVAVIPFDAHLCNGSIWILCEKSCTDTSFPSISVSVCIWIFEHLKNIWTFEHLETVWIFEKNCTNTSFLSISVNVGMHTALHSHQENRWQWRVQHLQFILWIFQCPNFLKIFQC